MPLTRIAGHAINAAQTGTGAPHLLIHCALSRHEMLWPLALELGGRATLFDLPGHGDSAAWDGQTDYHHLATQIAAHFCDGPTHVIGHSLGATVALRLAVTQPALVSRLTLIEPVYFAAAQGTPEHQAHGQAFRPFVAAMEQGDAETATAHFNDLWGHIPWPQISQKRQSDLIKRINLVIATAQAIEEDPDRITSPARLAKLTCPVSLIRGAQSPPVIAAIHDALCGRLPSATDHVIPDAGHMLPATHTAQVAAIILAQR